MLTNKNESPASSTSGKEKQKESKSPSKKIQEIQIETLDFNNSDGFVCDINTGICGPAKKDDEKK